MLFWIASAGGLDVAYLLGATPTGWLAGRLLKGIDLRRVGSGSTGATNVLRTVGPRAFAGVLLIDVLKGAAAIVFAHRFYAWLLATSAAAPPPTLDAQASAPWAVCLAGLAAILGHSRSVWLGFAGGKSVATGLGVLLAMSWPVGVGALAVWGAALALSRIMSLSSMLAALTTIALACLLPEPLAYRVFMIAGGAFVIARHGANVRRLLAGTEPRIGQAGTGAS